MTRADAIKQALQNLRVVDAISDPAAEDTATVGQRLDQVRGELLERGLCWWDAEDIPSSVALPFCALVAEASADAFGKQYAAQGASARIAAVKSSARREVVRTDYF